ncbi:MAG: SRPBCC family protein [Chloroflexi bacterium]|nr:SRPBCC family protein [Chloroflexota bacterium]
MASFDMSVWIDRKPKDVFDFVSNPPRAAEYIENIKSGKQVSKGKVGVGTVFSETRIVNGKEATTELTVREYDPPHRFGIGNETMGIDVFYLYHMEPEKDGTRLTWEAELSAKGLKKMMLPMVAGVMKKEDGDHLHAIKEILEGKRGG